MSVASHHLDFRELGLDGPRSIARDLPGGACRGIYAYEFADGTWYVGKAKDVRRRHAQHVAKWRREDPPLVPVRVLLCEVGGDDRELDDAETRAIAAFERDGRDLRNLMKTGRPGGAGDLVVRVEVGFGVEIPWERARRPRASSATCGHPARNRTESMARRLRRLEGMPWWGRALGLVAAYVSETVPAPDALACELWSATAYGSVRRGADERPVRSLLCLSVGNIETLALFADGEGPYGFLNMKAPAGRVRAGRRADVQIWDASYRSADDVVSAGFDTLEGLGALLSEGAVLDSCYRLNAEMLRRGSCMYARNSNAFLVDAILAEVVRGEAEG